MGFASAWLKDRALFPELINETPSPDTDIIVIVPSFDEPEITGLLNSLVLCQKPDCATEVIIIVNAPEGAGKESLINNRLSIFSAETWKKEHPECFFSLHIIDGSTIWPSGWTVGLARKAGMDEAVRRFDRINKPEGIILNLDADCKVKNNYFTAVYEEMHGRTDRSACSIYFEHPISGNEFPEEIYRSITLYELHLRYFLQGVAFTGFPWIHHAIGSAIAVKALAYVKAGGMNRKMAGEDFYFIQKLLPAGGFFNLNKTTVYPSPRTSARVPFGTGPTISRLTGGNNSALLTYNFKAFLELKSLFSITDKIFLCGDNDQDLLYQELPPGIMQFVGPDEWTSKLREIKGNTSGIQSFRKRFFGWFNLFRIVKYLNSIHSSVMEKKPVGECASELLIAMGSGFKTDDPAQLLGYYRSLELKD